MESNTTIEALKNIGLSTDQSSVYSYLLENGSLSASILSRRLNITRTLVYKVLDDLEKRDLVAKDETFKVTRFTAAHPLALRKLGESEKIAADNLVNRIETILGPLVSAYNLQSNKPAVHHMEGLKGVREIFADSLTAKEPIYMYADTDTLEQEILDLDESYVKKRLKKGILKKILMARTPAAEEYVKKSQSELTQTKLISGTEQKHFYSFMYIYDKKVSFVTYKDGNLTSTIIYDESIYAMQRFAFEALWQCSAHA